jgi:hypothetical protein
MPTTLDKAVNMVKQAAESAIAFQAQKVDLKEGRDLMKVVEGFLKDRQRLLYGGFALNALMPDKDKFYDQAKELPDYDFLTPDPIGDVVDLMNRFYENGYTEVEPSIGVHEGTYKVYVNYQAVADITNCDLELYEQLWKESVQVGTLRCCPVNYLRMNMYLELSHPAGDVSRWPKVYKRLLLFNKNYPLVACTTKEADELNYGRPNAVKLELGKKAGFFRSKILDHVIKRGEVVFGFSEALWIYNHMKESGTQRKKSLKDRAVYTGDPLVLFLSMDAKRSAEELSNHIEDTTVVKQDKFGELLTERYYVNYKGVPIASITQTSSCHAYVEVPYDDKTLFVASMDSLVNFYFSIYYANTGKYELGTPILCLCQYYVDWLAEIRDPRYEGKVSFPLFPVKCLGYQPGLPELKRLQRQRSKEERARIAAIQKIRQTLRTTQSNTKRKSIAASVTRNIKSSPGKSKTRRHKRKKFI